MAIEGESKEEAQSYIRFLDLEMANQDIEINANDAGKYFEYAQPAGISIDMYMRYKDAINTGGSNKKADIMRIINDLPITRAQKDVLYRANGWAESKIGEAPWR